MASFLVEGGHQLTGEITPQGAKNEALQVICATLLTAEEEKISNIPEILDVANLLDLLRQMGVRVDKLSKGEYVFCADRIDENYVGSEEFASQCAKLRGSVMLTGPLLARFHKATLAKPGGDNIGTRRLDTHLRGLAALGAKFEVNENSDTCHITAEKIKGTYILLDEASVTGTANIIMAAAMGEGVTTIYNAACEPYLQQLCRMLVGMGAKIEGIASNLLTITGAKVLHGTTHTILPDMIEVGSFIGMAAILGGGITIKNTSPRNLGIIPETFKRLGIRLRIKNNDIIVPKQNHYQIETFIDGSIMTISDSPWPGLTPDLLSVLIVTATQANGTVLFHQKMFESRLFFVDKLISMGAQIILCDPHRAVVVGHNHKFHLKARRMVSPDIRAGIALLIAAMSADGTSRIDNVEQIDRGYSEISERLNKLGAKIIRID